MKRKDVQYTPMNVQIEVEMSEDGNEGFDQHGEQQAQQSQLRISTCPKICP